jgi:hypothetical protein
MEVVLKAKFGYIIPNGRTSWEVVDGDTGILQWKRHSRYARFVEPLVVWDRDPDRVPRRLIFSSVEIIGIQAEQHRILVVPK